jgi:hypothetical protein
MRNANISGRKIDDILGLNVQGCSAKNKLNVGVGASSKCCLLRAANYSS